jgi:hypothetical protein
LLEGVQERLLGTLTGALRPDEDEVQTPEHEDRQSEPDQRVAGRGGIGCEQRDHRGGASLEMTTQHTGYREGPRFERLT